jgi:tetratricopeptide (TPR) repeat protein
MGVLSLLGYLVIGICALVMASGCAKKVAKQGILFDLDKVLTDRKTKDEDPKEEPWKEQGLRLAERKEFDKATEAFMRHVEEEPEEFFGFNALAICYKNAGDHAQAMKNFERALEFTESNEDKAKVLANIGNLYFAANKSQVALGYYKQAESLCEKNPLYLILISRAFLLQDEPERARTVLTKAEASHSALKKYERDEDRGLGYYLMAQSWAALGEEEKVLTYLEMAMKANPEKYSRRVEKEARDERSLFFTLKDQSDMKEMIKKYKDKRSPVYWLVLD